MEKPFPAYQGDEDYVFVCYAHDNSDVVYPEMAWLRDQGINLWYDEGISAGQMWRAELAERIDGASRMLAYVSAASLASSDCQRELHYALDHGIPILPVYIEQVPLTPDLEIGLSLVQALYRDGSDDHLQRLKAALSGSKPTSTRTPPARSRRWGMIGVVLAITFLTAIGLWWYRGNIPDLPSSTEFNAPDMTAEIEDIVVGIGVLDPNPGTDEVRTLAAHVRNELILGMQKTKLFRVSALEAGGSDADEIDYKLVGNVREDDDGFETSLRLTSADSGYVIWAQDFPSLVSVGPGERVRATYVASSIHRTLMIDRIPKPFANPEARALLTRALSRSQSRMLAETDFDYRVDIKMFEGVAALEPDYFGSYANLAILSAHDDLFDDIYEQSRVANGHADRALDLAPDNSFAVFAKAYVKTNVDRDFDTARRMFERARALGQQEADSHIANIDFARGDFEEALIGYRTAAGGTSDPIALLGIARCQLYLGRYHETLQAVARLDEALQRDNVSSPFIRATAYALLGEIEQAQTEIDAVLKVGSDWRKSFDEPPEEGLPGILALIGRETQAREVLANLETRFARGERFGSMHAFVGWFYLGDLDSAFKWLDRAIDRRETHPLLYGVEFEELRADPRFQAALERIDALTIRDG